MRNLSACSLPALKSATDLGFSAMIWSTSRRKLGKGGADFLDPFSADVERREIRFGKVAVILGELLASLRHGEASRVIPTTCFLHQAAAGFEHLGLALDLVADRPMDGAE